MGVVRVLSTHTIKASKSSNKNIDLTPWDLQHLCATPNKKGLLYHHPISSNQIQQLRHSLSSSLEFFQPLAGRLKITEHEDDHTFSCSIICNNEGVLFIHAEVENTCVADILEPRYVPSIVGSFFPFIGVRNYEGTSQPLLAVQVTELVDGMFVACTINHVVADGNSLWHFINSWAEISRSSCHHQISKLPTLERWFPDGTQLPIRFPFTMESQNNHSDGASSSTSDEELHISERLFHFTKEKILQLKSKVNTKIDSTFQISSLQVLFSHVWCSIIRSKQIDPQEQVHSILMIGVRLRFVPQLSEGYFGNAFKGGMVTMKAEELLKEDGVRNTALEINKLIASHSNEKIKNHYEFWLKNPNVFIPKSMPNNLLIMSSSPRFDVYGNDFGWGKPVGVRSSNDINGIISVFGGIEEGSIELQIRLPYNILEALGNDIEFTDVVSN
ncbi:protein ENHANCED PSEUDOMONAS SUSCEPTIBILITY 1-like [Vicia villosa]|uniref:protein ENHANCED PSEUDOMONAS SUSCEPTIBILITY 1-like n=1 Tax=Vicia villosa TaxID=3911 RepID=UPI00273B3433|nr:protein ENHANCED PSEUDOMONAS SUSCEPTIBILITY 1-like [Vicia villosa]